MLSNKLEQMVRGLEGARSAIVMGFDGIPVYSCSVTDGPDIETVGMELSVVLKEVRKAAELLEAGHAEELIVRTNKLSAVLRIINDGYFLALTLAPEGNTGKARYALRILAPEFRSELV